MTVKKKTCKKYTLTVSNSVLNRGHVHNSVNLHNFSNNFCYFLGAKTPGNNHSNMKNYTKSLRFWDHSFSTYAKFSKN